MKHQRIETGVSIVDMGAKGKSIGKKDGTTYLCTGGVPGDTVTVQVRKKKKNYFEAHVVSVDSLSNLRTEPICSHFGQCGGCAWQHMGYTHQRALKERQVVEQIRRLAGLTGFEALPILGSDQVFHYRNKMEYTFTESRWLTEEEIQSGETINNRKAVGFHVPGRFDGVMHVDTCYLQDDLHNAMRNFVHARALELEISYDHARNKTGTLRNILFRCNRKGQWMVILVVREETPEVQILLSELIAQYKHIISLWVITNVKVNDSFTDCPARLVYGEECIREAFERPDGKGTVTYRIGPKSFFQTNAHQAERLYETVYSWAGLTGNEVVYDLYTGTGSIALYVSDKASRVIGIEYVPEAIADAERNATDNAIDNCSFFAGDMQRVLTSEFIAMHGKPDMIITDPPRAGMDKSVVDRILEAEPKRIIYVSCDPATQARDIQWLSVKYDLIRIQPVDMFPHTAHLENIAELRLRV